jgi:N-acylneuraminate cytidylyltransferase
MIDGKTVLAVIPARGGSKGLPRKNIREAGGKPLIAWTIEVAQDSRYIDRLILSSDDPEIISVARSFGCDAPFVRPAALAQDDTPGIDPVLHAVNVLPGYDYIVLLQPTSPLRNRDDIDGCIEKIVKQQANACVSVAEAEKNPHWMFRIDDAERLHPFIEGEVVARRQDLPKVYVLNGAVYVAQCEWLLRNRTFLTAETMAYLMPGARSLDIDTEHDMAVFSLMCGLL